MFALDIADKSVGVSLWIGKSPVATALVRRAATSDGNVYIVESGLEPLRMRSVDKGSRYSRMTAALEHCVDQMMNLDSVNKAVCSVFVMEDGYVGVNKKTSLEIAEQRGAAAEMMIRTFGLHQAARVKPDEWRSTITKTLHPGLVWPKDRNGCKEMMLQVARLKWTDLPRSGIFSPDEADSLGVGWHYVSTGGYFEK